MKYSIKIMIIITFFFLITCSLSGCMTITQEDYLKAASRYMEKKYGEEFEGKYFYGMNNDSLYVYPIAHPEWEVTVTFSKKRIWNVEFHDNYVGFLLKEEMEKAIEEVAAEVYGNCKPICLPLGFAMPDEWDRDTTLEEYNFDNRSKLYLFISDYIGDREIGVNIFLEKFSDTEININIIEIVNMQKEQLKLLDENQKNYIFSNDLFYWRASIVLNRESDNIIDYISWRDGAQQYKSLEGDKHE